MNTALPPKRYNSIAIILHWVMALGFFVMLASGIVMEYVELDQSLKFKLYQWHKSGGVVMLLALAVRLVWRLISMSLKQVPKLPAAFPKWERLAAHAGHWGLYIGMLAMPLSGWVMVSSSVYGLPTIVFDMFEWPHIPGLQGNEAVESRAKTAHFVIAIVFSLMIFAHIGAVIKHAVQDNENLLTRMWWGKHKGEV